MCRENFLSDDRGLILRAKGGFKPNHLLKGHVEFAQSSQYQYWQCFSSQKDSHLLVLSPCWSYQTVI